MLKIEWQIYDRKWQRINWLSIHERISQCSLRSIYKFFAKNSPNYFDEVYVALETNGVHTSSSYQKLNVLHQETNVGQKTLSYVGHSLWNNLSKTLKTSISLNTHKHNSKKHYFNKFNKFNKVLIAVSCFLYFWCFKVSIFIWIQLSICMTLKPFLLYFFYKKLFFFS